MTVTGMRGMIALSIEVKGPSRDLHSGNEGGKRRPLIRCSEMAGSMAACQTFSAT